MGWYINISLDKPITEGELGYIIDKDLPLAMKRGRFGKQSWGWSLNVDVRIPDEKTIRLSGSYGLSGNVAELSAEVFARHLEKRGYVVDIGDIE